MILLTDWNVAWLMTGIGFGTVFTILCLLVIILTVFSAITQSTTKATAVKAIDTPAKTIAEASELDKAAVATAIYLYQKSKGDQESGVLTIKKTPTAWHAVLNERL